MTNIVNTSFQVSFGDQSDGADAQGHLSAEVDDRASGLNDGVTSFVPGDTVGFLVYKSDNVSISAGPTPSAGAVAGAGSTVVTKEAELTFGNTDTATLQIPAESVTLVKWLGNSLGGITLESDKTTVKAGTKGVGIARVTYNAKADQYTLSSPARVNGESDYSILVYIEGAISA